VSPSTCRIDSSHQYPPARSASSSDKRQAGHPPFEEDGDGPRAEPVTDGLQPGRVRAGGEPVGQGGEADPRLGGLPLGPLVRDFGVLAIIASLLLQAQPERKPDETTAHPGS